VVGLGYAFEEFTIGRLSNVFHCNNIQGETVSVSTLKKPLICPSRCKLTERNPLHAGIAYLILLTIKA